ncbi:MAG: glycoside hydrolase 43 family protein [Planctomycetaceae bacterium]|nr:glycoside hydrolase 43 family protein [Planctomycetaceae bacterium]
MDPKRKSKSVFVLVGAACFALQFAYAWQSDNGNGTYTNPLFYDEFSDPDLIRVGDDYYLTGTTMHCMPGLPVLHSKDLVNWDFLCYAFERLDLGPEFRLVNGREVYGQGIWAPCFRYHDGTFYIFSNVNGRTTQMFQAKNPAGPWTRIPMKRGFHDLSMLFDDDGKVYIVWGYQGINFAQLNDDLTDAVPGTERIIIPKDAGMGEGLHFYKIDGKYFITSAWFNGRMRMPCARGDKPEGPYEVNPAISMDEDFGLAEGNRLRGRPEFPFNVVAGNTNDSGRMSMHQGGIVSTPSGQWWGFSMMDYNSIGRLTCLSPVTWKDGWPYFGLENNLKRSPRTWTKPDTRFPSEPVKPYERSDDFSASVLKPIWQWNHMPVDEQWSLTERPGFLRLHGQPAADLLRARNSLTQRSIGPVSVPTAKLDASGMKPGDLAGLALLNIPYAWIGVHCEPEGLFIEQFDQFTGKTQKEPLKGPHVWLRAHCDFLTEKAALSYSADGKTFKPLGDEFTMVFQYKTFQGVRYTLFSYSTTGGQGGFADFDDFTVDEPHANGLMRPIPFAGRITLWAYGDDCVLAIKDGALKAVPPEETAAILKVIDRGLGRVAFECDGGFVSVVSADGKQLALKKGPPAEAETFQWAENVYGDLVLMSLVSHKHLRLDKDSGVVTADQPGPKPNRKDGSCLTWRIAQP